MNEPEEGSQDHTIRLCRGAALYLRERGREEDLVGLAREIGLLPEDLVDGDRRISHSQFEAFALGLRHRLGSDEEFIEANAWRAARGAGIQALFLRAFSPAVLYQQAAKSHRDDSSIGRLLYRRLGPLSAELRYDSPRPESRLLCMMRKARLAAFPVVWGLPPASVEDRACLAHGDGACVYHFRWHAHRRAWPLAAGAGAGALASWGLDLPAPPLDLVLPLLGLALGNHLEGLRVQSAHLADLWEADQLVADLTMKQRLLEEEGRYPRMESVGRLARGAFQSGVRPDAMGERKILPRQAPVPRDNAD